MVYAISITILSSQSCSDCFIMPYVTANPPIIFSASSCKGSNHCTKIFYSSLICSISSYNCIFARMVNMHSIGGRVFMFSLDLCVFSYAFLTLSSISFSSEFTISCVQIHVISSHSLTHSSPRLLMLTIEVIIVLSLCSFFSSGVPGVVSASNFRILLRNP
jgi:hypothetical protein